MAEANESAGLPILIIGAGCSGLALAHGLHLKRIPYKLFEKDTSLAPRNGRDWGISFHWSRDMLASLIGDAKWSRINEALVDPYISAEEAIKVPLINGSTGEVINVMSTPDMRRVLRSRLRSLIADDVLDVQFGKALEHISYADDGRSVTAYFADGAAETGCLVIGADGSQSQVRSLLLGSERASLTRLPLAATFVTASFSRERALWLRSQHAYLNALYHPNNEMGMFALLDGKNRDAPESWRFSFYVSWRSPLEEQTEEVASGMSVHERLLQFKGKSKDFADPIRSCREWISDDLEEVYWGGCANWDPSLPEHTWDNHGGLVTLIGDAAHPMTYHRGQGLNHSVADAFKLFEKLANVGIRSQKELIDAYESEMRARGGEEVRLSEMNSFMVHDWDQVGQSPIVKRGMGYGSGNESKA
ncbi:FAD/NAD(P)-binding domain-containing protein [Durotheca rogersii]|uniref:FAD/NAD(P)-binding domain-containing protein n=1 Tax=Durotheca rogersii TaxID=419775 RepID=UPI0022211172|nr:FAD/NAD(P)-binding domain-containing protein [Durotheca rogersii]KAI5865564.1 FAD/NAD(P)-binding domain-containing protein [Durotheca rogersii]